MKKRKANYSLIAIICCSFISIKSFAQTNNNQDIIELPTSTIVHLPITTQNTTDPNYETNVLKYKDFKAYVPVTEIIVKDKAYYLKEIQDIKNDIANKENMELKSPDVIMKIENLKFELNLLETKLQAIN